MTAHGYDSHGARYEDLLELLAEQLQAGDRLDAAVLAERYPKYARRLAGVLPLMQAMQELRESECEPARRLPAEVDEPERFLGLEIGDCRIIRLVGRGGSSLVFEGIQPRRGRVAVKLMTAAAAGDAQLTAAFWQAGAVGRRLHHSRIVPTFEQGEWEGRPYAILKLIDGSNLAVLIAEQWLKLGPAIASGAAAGTAEPRDDWRRRALQWVIDAAETLHAAHGQRVVHGDLKPGNLLIDAVDRLWVADLSGADGRQTCSASPTTLRYLSPERLAGDRGPSVASDVYALGATLFELLALEPAFTATSPARLRNSILNDFPPPLAAYDPAICPEIAALVTRCLAKEPLLRPSSALEVARVLRSLGGAVDLTRSSHNTAPHA
jgi:serine/threonine protein kinase